MPALGLGVGVEKSKGTIDPDAFGFINRAGIVDTIQQSAIYKLVSDLKQNNVWNKMAAIYPFVGGTAASHSQNLKSASYPISWFGTVLHNAYGIRGDGTTGHGRCVGTAAAQVHLGHKSVYSRGYNGAGTHDLFGSNNTVPNYYIMQSSNDSDFLSYMGSTASSVTKNLTPPIGFFISSRETNTSNILYLNGGAPTSTTTSSAGGGAFVDDYILCRNDAGAGGAISFSAANIAFYSIGDALSPTHVGFLNQAVDAFQQTLNRRYDPDVANYFLRTGFSVNNNTEITAIEKFVFRMKSSPLGLWGKMTALYPFIGGTATTNAQNLKSSSFTITWNGTVTHSIGISAMTYNTSFGNTGVLMNSLNLLDVHISHYLAGVSTVTDTMGAFDGASAILEFEAYIGPATGVTADCNILADGRMTGTTPINLLAHSTITRRSASDAAVYNRGSVFGTKTTPTSNPGFAQPIFVLARNQGAGNGLGSSDPTMSMMFASIGSGLTDAAVLAFNDIVQQLQDDLGRRLFDGDTIYFAQRAGVSNITQLRAVDDLVLGLKSAGLWSKMVAIYPYVGGTALAHSQNLKSNLYTITWANSPTQNALGVTCNGTNQCGLTGLKPSDIGTPYGGISVMLKAVPVGDSNKSAGVDNSVDRIYDIVHDVTSNLSYGRYGAVITAAIGGPVVPAFYSINRLSDTNLAYYKNGILGGSNAASSTVSALASNWSVFASNGGAFFSEETQSFIAFHQGLTAGENLAFYNLVLAYNTALGR